MTEKQVEDYVEEFPVFGTEHMKELMRRIKPIKLDEPVLQPDYHESYAPMKSSLAHFSWVNLYLAAFPAESPKMHYQMIDFLGDEEQEIQSIEVHREGAKTTVVTLEKILHAMQTGVFEGYGEATNICVFTSTTTMAVDMMKNLKFLRESSEELYASTPLAKTRDGKIVADREDEIAVIAKNGKTVHVQFKSKGAAMRSTQRDNVRIEVVIFDDILTDDEMYSEATNMKTLKWITGTVLPAMSSTVKQVYQSGYKRKKKAIFIGTPMARTDAIRTMTSSEEVPSMMFPIMQNMGTENAVTSWKDLHGKEEVMKDYRFQIDVGTIPEFMREKMLEVDSVEERLIAEKDLIFWDTEEMKDKLHELTFYTSIDIAATNTATSAMFSVITIGVDEEGIWYIMMIDLRKMSPRELINVLFDHRERLPIRKMKAERVSIQHLLNYFLYEEQLKRNDFFQIDWLKDNTRKSKELRIRSLPTKFEAKGVRLCPLEEFADSTAELVKQLRGLQKYGALPKLIDGVDGLANFNDPGFLPKGKAISKEVFTDLILNYRAKDNSRIIN